MEKFKVKTGLTLVLAMPTAGKTHLQKLCEAKTDVKIIDVDDLYDHDLKVKLSKDDVTMYQSGAFLEAVRLAKESIDADSSLRVIILTNLWFRSITRSFDFDLAVNRSVLALTTLSKQRGDNFDRQKVVQWIESAKNFYPKVSKVYIELKDDQFLSDVIDLD